MMRRLIWAAVLGCSILSGGAWGQTAPDPACQAVPAALPVPWTAWASPVAMVAGKQKAHLPAVALGKAATLALAKGEDLELAGPTGTRARIPGTFGGLFTIGLAKPAKVGVGLSGAAWVDVVSAGETIASNSFGHGPDCSGIRKIVWFDLPAGNHVVQIVNAPEATIRAMVVG